MIIYVCDICGKTINDFQANQTAPPSNINNYTIHKPDSKFLYNFQVRELWKDRQWCFACFKNFIMLAVTDKKEETEKLED